MTSATPMPSRPSSRNLLAATLTIRACVSALANKAATKCSEKDFIKYFATSGLRSYSIVVKAQINLFGSTGEAMSDSSPERNKAIVLEAFETLFNKRDYAAAERF